ncbi:hypothetical protein GCM10014713_46950 [Streptomyces purpureus]|uniref:Uncharacterized protein n=1 Tax=Streptomyces purpureus TaxID=1951 RepID=A0A918HB96_9ACTN|nr:hypothetical protein GCM10014713_46950 [Streptomyces purpureus]
MGKASQEPVREAKKATMAWMSVTAVSNTARTAAVRTGSGIRRRLAGSSTHNGRGTLRSAMVSPAMGAPARRSCLSIALPTPHQRPTSGWLPVLSRFKPAAPAPVHKDDWSDKKIPADGRLPAICPCTENDALPGVLCHSRERQLPEYQDNP